MSKIQIESHHLALLQTILKQQKQIVYIFGSRAKGTAKKFSDLDLVIKGFVDRKILRKIQEDLEESNLPYKVDLIIWDEIDEDFKSIIGPDLQPFPI
jgi:predicted nucleotidyltransferase